MKYQYKATGSFRRKVTECEAVDTLPEAMRAHQFLLRLHLAGKTHPRARVTDNRAHYYLRRHGHNHGITPLRQPPARLLAARRALIWDNVITWGAVVAVVWWLVSR